MTKIQMPIDGALLARVTTLLNTRDEATLPQGHVRPKPTVKAQADGPGAELLLYDEIGFWGIWATDVASALSTVSGPLHVRINSPGGDVFDGIAIYNMLADYPDQVTVTVDGLAASAASFIAQAGDRVIMNRASQMMIHDASGGCRGNAADMRALAALLDMISGTIAGIYAGRAGGDVDEWRERMQVDAGFGTWYTAESAVEAGLADELVAPPSAGQDGDSDGDGDGAQPDPMDRVAAAQFPYEGRWRLAAMVPAASVEPHEPSAGEGDAEDHTGVAPVDQAPAPGTPPAPGTASEPEPVPVPTPRPQPDDAWAAATSHLTTPPSTEDVWESLKEALLR